MLPTVVCGFNVAYRQSAQYHWSPSERSDLILTVDRFWADCRPIALRQSGNPSDLPEPGDVEAPHAVFRRNAIPKAGTVLADTFRLLIQGGTIVAGQVLVLINRLVDARQRATP